MRSALLVALVVLAAAPAAAQTESPYRLPFEAGTSRRCTQSNNGTTSHSGRLQFSFDFAMAVGEKIAAARSGRVVTAKDAESKNGKDGLYGGSGNHIKIDHGDGTFGWYLHLAHEGALVEEGAWVVQGEVIGLSGNTGRSTGPHLHFHVADGRGQSIAIAFADVDTDGGVPASGKTYTSRNTAGIPPATKDELERLERAAQVARDEGFPALAHEALAKLVKIDLPVPYPPRDEAAARIAELEALPGVIATEVRCERASDFEAAARRLILALPGIRGLPGARTLRDVEKELAEDPRFGRLEDALALEVKLRGRYAKGLEHELLKSPRRALGHYRYVARRAEGTDLGGRVAARLEALETRLAASARARDPRR